MALIILIPLIMNDWEGLEHRLKQIYESVKSLPDEESEVPAFQVHEQGRSEENEEEKDPVNVLKAVGEGIFNSDGETWRFQRKTAALEFTTRTLRQAMARRGSKSRSIPVRLGRVVSTSTMDGTGPIPEVDILPNKLD